MKALAALVRRSQRERRLLAEAAALHARAALLIRFGPFPRAIAFGTIPLAPARPADLSELLWAVDAAARRMPFRTACFERGLTVQRMLRRRGRDARLHYGIAPGAEIEAHVWVTLDGAIVTGGEEAPRFQEVGQWP